MKDLTPGFYYIGFDTAKSGHAISLIIEDHKKGYLVDPNYGTFEFNNEKDMKKILETIIQLYAPPEKPTSKLGSYHNIRCFEAKKSDIPQPE